MERAARWILDSVIDKEQRLSEGHSEAEDRKFDFEEVTQQEEWFRMEPLHGARPKWNRLGRPTSVIEAPRSGGRGHRGHRRFGSEGGRDESSGSTVATASSGYTRCGGSTPPRRDTGASGPPGHGCLRRGHE